MLSFYFLYLPLLCCSKNQNDTLKSANSESRATIHNKSESAVNENESSEIKDSNNLEIEFIEIGDATFIRLPKCLRKSGLN